MSLHSAEVLVITTTLICIAAKDSSVLLHCAVQYIRLIVSPKDRV